MIPDFVPQTKEILREFMSRAEVTYQYWQDSVAYRYREDYIKRYEQDLDTYVNGGTNQTGMGLEELLRFIDEKSRMLSEISGIPSSDYLFASAPTHDNHLIRNEWNDDYRHPGELDYGGISDVMEEREKNS